ncbi:uncharacterized protein BT62DRAFT_1011091 [Guyanagaster necrorhizus]|uniref:Uncharacterized protein n=1 Tax=Guyanagaster necrorhizus TaxID=856835 RepID=A0A9P7VJJ7_9AGAR|nr:uncharacterized protein BT62DRAFT_1011091 [Guyanagaster necrorhizus MCA 3950]KAG7441797.1 hypothetical protein BT62DRAFT_1011091 [Guyanagaster necrorhizus MCA 3950]
MCVTSRGFYLGNGTSKYSDDEIPAPSSKFGFLERSSVLSSILKARGWFGILFVTVVIKPFGWLFPGSFSDDSRIALPLLITFSACKGSMRHRIEAHMGNHQPSWDNWREMCSTTPTDYDGHHFDQLNRCYHRGIFGDITYHLSLYTLRYSLFKEIREFRLSFVMTSVLCLRDPWYLMNATPGYNRLNCLVPVILNVDEAKSGNSSASREAPLLLIPRVIDSFDGLADLLRSSQRENIDLARFFTQRGHDDTEGSNDSSLEDNMLPPV